MKIQRVVIRHYVAKRNSSQQNQHHYQKDLLFKAEQQTVSAELKRRSCKKTTKLSRFPYIPHEKLSLFSRLNLPDFICVSRMEEGERKGDRMQGRNIDIRKPRMI